MKIKDWLKESEVQLNKAGIGSSRLDCLILLEDALKQDRSWILANQEKTLSKTKLKSLSGKIKKRINHLPLAYVRGHSEFYGRKFMVNRHVLEPRPESETMIEQLLKLPLPKRPAIADVGTGSGCLGITAALELHDPNVDMFDIDASALAVARHNQVLHELHLHVRKSNLLSRPLRPYDVVLANLPYVPIGHKINQAAAMEPKIAIFGGEDGLDVYRKLFAQLEHFTWKPKFVLTESLPPQHTQLIQIAMSHGFMLHFSKDFIQIFRSI